MNVPISNPADCEVRGVIRFLQAENVRPSEIQIVTGDETWISHNTPLANCNQWSGVILSRQNKPHKFKQTASARKLMATVFCDRQGVLLVDFMPCNTTINAEAYCATLRRHRKANSHVALFWSMTMHAHIPPG